MTEKASALLWVLAQMIANALALGWSIWLGAMGVAYAVCVVWVLVQEWRRRR